MAFWWKKNPRNVSFQKWDLPGDVGTVSLPSFLPAELANGDTLIAYRDDSLTLRLSSISFTPKDPARKDAAQESVRRRATENRWACSQLGDKTVSCHDEQADEEGVPLVIRFWYVGSKSTIVIISATIVATGINSAAVREVLDLMPQVIESLTITVSYRSLDVDGEVVSVATRSAENTEQQVTPFGDFELAWLEAWRPVAIALGLKYASGGELTPDELDRVLSRWTVESRDKEPPESVANALGVAFGDYLVENDGFDWFVVTDE